MTEYTLGLYEKALPFGMSFGEMFTAASDAGFDRFEISIDETDGRLSRLDLPYEEQKRIGDLSRKAGAPMRTMCLSGHRRFPMGSHDPQIRERSMEIMTKAVDFSANAGISLIQLAGYDVYYEEGDEETEKYFRENLFRSAEYAASRGVALGFETMETPFMDTVEKCMKYVDLIGSPWLGMYPDIGNMKNASVLYGTDVAEDLEKGRDKIFAVHLKETRPGIYRDLNFGTGGHTEYVRCIKTALDHGCRMFTGEFWYQNGQDYRMILRESNAFLREKIREAQNA